MEVTDSVVACIDAVVSFLAALPLLVGEVDAVPGFRILFGVVVWAGVTSAETPISVGVFLFLGMSIPLLICCY